MKQYLKQLFSDSGEASFSRLGSSVALAAGCGWISFVVWKTHALPHFQGLTIFIATLYGLGKAGETVQRVGGKKS